MPPFKRLSYVKRAFNMAGRLSRWNTEKRCEMKKYKIKVVETLSKVVEVEAEDYDLAFDKVEEMVDCEEVVLTADDFEGREFYPAEDYGKDI